MKTLQIFLVCGFLFTFRSFGNEDCPPPYPYNWQGRIADFSVITHEGKTYISFEILADYDVVYYEVEFLEDGYRHPIINNFGLPDNRKVLEIISRHTQGCVRLWKINTHGNRQPLGLVKAIPQIPKPTAVILERFLAVENNGNILISWTTLSEAGTIGYHLEYEDHGWKRLTETLIPATGYIGQRTYKYNQMFVAKKYRLIEVDIYGKNNPLSETETKKALNIQLRKDRLQVFGSPNCQIVLEYSEDLLCWSTMQTNFLGQDGTLSIPIEIHRPQFYIRGALK